MEYLLRVFYAHYAEKKDLPTLTKGQRGSKRNLSADRLIFSNPNLLRGAPNQMQSWKKLSPATERHGSSIPTRSAVYLRGVHGRAEGARGAHLYRREGAFGGYNGKFMRNRRRAPCQDVHPPRVL